MSMIRMAGFGGENRALHPSLLPDSAAVSSLNQRPGRGDLRPWRAPLTVATVPAGRKTIYRMGRDVASDSSYWLSWTTAVHAARGFDSADTTERTYYTGDGAPKVTDNVMGLASTPYPTASRPLGIPAPATAPTISNGSGSSTTNVTRYYVYTYVNDWGWESGPSPVSAMNTRPSDATATVSGFAAAPAGNYNINRIRVYETETGASGATEFFFLREIGYGTVSTTDDLRALGEVLPTADWIPAPGVPQGGAGGATEAALSFLTPLWNGMLAAISANGVRFCEPYTAYTWPIKYEVLPADGKPVAIGVYGQSVLVLTTSRPMLLAGSGPDAMDQQTIEMPQGCVAPKSVVSMGTGVAWASEDGLCWYGAGGARILTSECMLREDWQAMVPSSIVGCMYEGCYFGSYDPGTGRKGFIVDPNIPQSMLFLEVGYEAMHFDELQDQLYVLAGTNVSKWNAGALMTVKRKGKLYRMPKPTPAYRCAQVVADAYPMTARFYADGVLKHTQTVTNGKPFSLPTGYRFETWQMETESTNPVLSITAASSPAELAQV